MACKPFASNSQIWAAATAVLSNSTSTQQQADLPEAHKVDIYAADVMQISVDNVPQACICVVLFEQPRFWFDS
jgi:hypothetical protein